MRRNLIKWFAFGFIGFVGLVSIVASGGSSDDDDDTTPLTETIVYKVEGSVSPVRISYDNDMGGKTEIEDVALPWQSQPFEIENRDYICLIASHRGGQTGTLSSTIYINNEILDSSTTEGRNPYDSTCGRVEWPIQ